MNMDMYWSQQEVFLMGTLALFPKELVGKPITPDGKWRYYFDGESMEQLVQQLNKYREAGYIEFDEKTVKVMPIGSNDALNFRTMIDSVTIKRIDSSKAKSNLIGYLESYIHGRLLTNKDRKPDDSTHQHEKLLEALRQVHGKQTVPHITMADVYGKDTDYAPFWEAVLAPQLIANQYEVRWMAYDIISGQPFADIEIMDANLRNLLEETHSPSAKQLYATRVFISDEGVVNIEIDGDKNYGISRRFRSDSAPHKFINHVLSHPRTRISRGDIKIVTGSTDITELVRGCGFNRTLKKIFFSGTTEQVVLFNPSPTIKPAQAKYIEELYWKKVGKTKIPHL